MHILTTTEAILIFSIFAATMFLLVWKLNRREHHLEGYLLAGRDVSLWRGALSVAVSWIWAPAIFICSLQSYTKGIAGIFWFTLPNVLCFFVFAPFALRVRRLMPNGYTLPEVIRRRFPDEPSTHIAFLLVFFGYQLGALIINALAGGALLHTVSGIEISKAIAAISALTLSYSLLSGLRASISTDVLQMAMILLVTLILIPWCLLRGDGVIHLQNGFAGVDGAHPALFDPQIAFAMGIPMTLALIAGPFGDQMFFQRTFAMKKESLAKTFILAGLLFALVPISLSVLGFMGASLEQQGLLAVSDPQMVAPEVIAYLLPKPALYLFCLMALAGLCSTMDSALCAGSSLATIDIYKSYIHPLADEDSLLRVSRISMIALSLIATAVALLQPKLLWVFLIYGAMVSASMFPTIFSLCWNRISARAARNAVLFSLLLGTPLSIYANYTENTEAIVFAAIISVAIGFCICLISGLRGPGPVFDFGKLGASYQR